VDTDAIGRERELSLILDRAAGDSQAVLLLEGEAGIGKTTLWRAALEALSEGRHALVARPAPLEASLSFAVLADLLKDCNRDGLPPPQRHALEVALLLGDPQGAPPESRAVGAATLTLLAALLEQQPVLLAIDDVQWVDAESASALSFALRRLDEVPLTLAFTRRSGSADGPLDLDRVFAGRRVERLRLHGLSLGALHRVLHERTGIVFPRPMLRRLHDTSAGNPLHALELARAVERRGATDDSLPLPATLTELVDERLAKLPPRQRSLLAAVAALHDPTERAVQAAGLSEELPEAERSGLIERDGHRLHPGHPLYAAAALDRLSPAERRQLHRELARIEFAGEAHALHVALATDGADEDVAGELERAAGAARDRGALETAARLFAHAARVTPRADRDGWARRLLAAAYAHGDGGDVPRARALAQQLVDELPPGARRAESLSLLGWIGTDDSDLNEAAHLSRRALLEVEDRPDLEALFRYRLGEIELIRGNSAECAVQVRRAAELAEEAGDRTLEALALSYVGWVDTFAGAGVTHASRRAVELERSVPGFLGGDSPSMKLGQLLTYTDQPDEANDVLERVLEQATAAGYEETQARVLFHLAVLECRRGNWPRSAALGHEATALFHQTANEQAWNSSRSVTALVAALRGSIDEARAVAKDGLARARAMNDAIFTTHFEGIVGLCALSLGEHRAAADALAPATQRLVEMGTRELSVYPVVQYDVDARIATGDLDGAARLVALLERYATESGRTWHRVIGTRGAALLASAGGDLTGALELAEHALELQADLPQPFERARTLLAAGTIARRARKRGRAHEALSAASELFERLGARVWAATAQGERDRVGLRKSPATLTTTERRIATMAAQGLTNREIAAAAFVSPKTVEANLAKIYRKLGLRSRVELARHFPTEVSSE
jgi:DNA-binding CsgD family transcriptional regulator